jgi:hypothetical protein
MLKEDSAIDDGSARYWPADHYMMEDRHISGAWNSSGCESLGGASATMPRTSPAVIYIVKAPTVRKIPRSPMSESRDRQRTTPADVQATILIVKNEPAIPELVAVNLEHVRLRDLARAPSRRSRPLALGNVLPVLVADFDWCYAGPCPVPRSSRLPHAHARGCVTSCRRATAVRADKIAGPSSGRDDYTNPPPQGSPKEGAWFARIRQCCRRSAAWRERGSRSG